jgi:hypothetical protein
MSTTVPRHARQRGRHRCRTPEKRQVAAEVRGRHRCGTPEKRHIAAGVALLGASVITGASVLPPPPAAPLPSERSIASAEVRLAANSSVLNIPVNLLIDLINIPNNEIQAMDYSAKAFLFSGPWLVVGPTNVWGVDPGDPPKFMSVVNMLVPFPALSGIGLDEFDQTGLGQQVWFFAATQLPTSVDCDDEGCMPTVPTVAITGIALIDSTIWSVAILTGQVKFPLFDNLFKVPISGLTSGFTFGPDWPGRVSPAGLIYPGFGFAGTVIDPMTGKNVVPWDGMTFTLDLSKPFNNYFDHLMADPSTNPIQLPDLEQFGRAIQSLAAAMVVAFDPFTPGSFLCPGDCSFIPAAMDYPGIVKSIGDLWPGNPVIDEWLNAYENGTANVPTEEQVQLAIKLKEGHFWTFDHPALPAGWIKGFDFTSLAPQFHALWTALGLNPPPLEEDPFQDPDTLDAPGPTSELRATMNVSQETASEQTHLSAPNATTLNSHLNTDPATPDNQVTNDAFSEVQQDDPFITPAVVEAPSGTAPNSADPTDDQKLKTEKIRDGNMAVPGRGRGTGSTSHAGLSDALRSATDQISSSISAVTSGLTGGAKTDESSAGAGKDSNNGVSGTGGRHRAE